MSADRTIIAGLAGSNFTRRSLWACLLGYTLAAGWAMLQWHGKFPMIGITLLAVAILLEVSAFSFSLRAPRSKIRAFLIVSSASFLVFTLIFFAMPGGSLNARADDTTSTQAPEFLAHAIVTFDREKLGKYGINSNDALNKLPAFYREHADGFKESDLWNLSFKGADGQVYALKDIAKVEVVFRSTKQP